MNIFLFEFIFKTVEWMINESLNLVKTITILIKVKDSGNDSRYIYQFRTLFFFFHLEIACDTGI